MSSPKEGAVGEQQHEMQLTRNEGWMSKLQEEVLRLV
jgi:hypothetical protein